MASAPTLPLVPVEEYLDSSYEHDVDYVDGVLIERSMPTVSHDLLQKILLVWLAQFEEEFEFEAVAEVRTQIIERARYRIPDVMLCARPLPAGRFFHSIPLAIFEILSPEDTLIATRDRLLDYERIGVSNIVLMDPENYLAYEFRAGSLISRAFQELQLQAGRLPFDSEALFAQLRAKRS